MRTRVKICGICTPDDAMAAIDAGADAIGLVFHQPSPRNISIEQAIAISRVVPPFVARVALLMDADPDVIHTVIDAVDPDCLQFHGSESPADCERYRLPYIKAFGAGEDLAAALAQAGTHGGAAALLFDGHAAGAAGGSGRSFDWDALPSLNKPLVLAGGLTPDNVAAAIAAARPFAVDVSSGVETAPGKKSSEKIRAFMTAVKQADADHD